MYKLDPLKDEKSSVELLHLMGDDLMVVDAARVSMNKQSDWDMEGDEWVPSLKEADKRLIQYLATHNHWTPFSHPQVQLRIKMPIFIARQWFKHMVGFTRNEVSRRYVSDTPDLHIPAELRLRAPNVKQGSSDKVFVEDKDNDYNIYNWMRDSAEDAVNLYGAMLDAGICPEQARMVLPQSMYTEFIETGSLAAYARLAKLRLDPHAQKEVRLYAEAVDDILSKLFPVSWEALRG